MGGRPTKYKPEYCEKIIEYFSRSPYVENSKGEKKPNDLPYFAEFASQIDVSFETLLEWTKKHSEFSDSYKRAAELQKFFLIQNTLLGLYNSTFAIFTAKNITDMRNVETMEHTGKDGTDLTFRIIEDTTLKDAQEQGE
jgi:hypothetical protein